MHIRGACLSLLLLLPPQVAAGQIRVHPPGVNVNTHGATTVFLTFGGLRPDQTPAEAFWCGELIPAPPPALGLQCDPATLFGRLPIRFDRSAADGSAFSDIMSIPPSVARRAYQAAVDGAVSSFFYVRRFTSSAGGPDEYVAVTCRLSSGGARTPLALTEADLRFEVETPVLYVRPGERPPPFWATITYNGTGRLVGRWEIVLPGEQPPAERDLLTEATLPPEERGTQRRFTQLQRFNHFLPPSGRFRLPGPPPDRLPTEAEGAYQILLRIEASDDKESESSRELAGAGEGVVRSGGVAGFPMPTLRYFVTRGGGNEPAGRPASAVEPVAPADRAVVAAAEPLTFRWTGDAGGGHYRLEVVDSAGSLVLAAIVSGDTREYASPPWLAERGGPGPLRWRVVALDSDGREARRSAWRRLRFGG